MADGDPKTAPGLVLNLNDIKTWAVILALIGIPTGVNKLSLSSVENKQDKTADAATRAVETQSGIAEQLVQLKASTEALKVSTESKLADIKTEQGQGRSMQDQMLGEFRWRQGQVESSVRDLQASFEAMKKGNK